MGIDEAGRGPVLGPMVYACAYCQAQIAEGLTSRGYADSKVLNDERRQELLGEIEDDGDVAFYSRSISAEEISAAMLSRGKVSLNEIAFQATCSIIEAVLAQGNSLTHVYVDTVGDPGSYTRRLQGRFPGPEFIVEPKADAKYPIASAASIVAKVTRDR